MDISRKPKEMKKILNSFLIFSIFTISITSISSHALIDFGSLGKPDSNGKEQSSNSINSASNSKIVNVQIKDEVKEVCACVQESSCAGQPGIAGPRQTRGMTFNFNSENISTPSDGFNQVIRTSSSSSSSGDGQRIVNKVRFPPF